MYIFLQQGIKEFKTGLQGQVVMVKTLGLFIKELVFGEESNDILKKWNWAGPMCSIYCLHIRISM